jgi:hypothetical protein
VLDTATSVGGYNVSAVVADTAFESADTYAPLTDCIVIGEYVLPALSPVIETGLDVTSASTETPFIYTV